MVSKKLRYIVIAGALASVAVLCRAQEASLKAEIGFPFRISSATLPAGNYDLTRVNMTSGSLIWRLRETKNHAGVLIVPRQIHTPLTAESVTPQMVFRCDSKMCALAEVRLDDGRTFAPPPAKLTPGEKERLAVVPLQRNTAD